MKLSVDEARQHGIIKSSYDIVLDNDMKKKMKEGTIHDDFDEINMGSYVANLIDVEKVAQVRKDLDYIYPPLKRNFKSFVRITSFIVVAYIKFKKKMVLAKTKRGINFPLSKFISFIVILNGKVPTRKLMILQVCVMYFKPIMSM